MPPKPHEPSRLVRTLTILIFLLTGCAVPRPPGAPSRKATDIFIFVGELQWLRPYEPKREPGYQLMDEAFQARYRVLGVIQGKYDHEFVEFGVYDHYGAPAFATNPTAVLYLSRDGEGFVHEKYQFDHVYRTADGRWAGCGNPYSNVKIRSRHLQRIDFEPAVEFDVTQLQEARAEGQYPPPIFEVSGNRARCRMGVYAEELARIRLETVFRERGHRDN